MPRGGASRKSRRGFARAIVDSVGVDGLEIVIRIREVDVGSSIEFLKVGNRRFHIIMSRLLVGYSTSSTLLSSRSQELPGLCTRRPRYFCGASLSLEVSCLLFYLKLIFKCKN